MLQIAQFLNSPQKILLKSEHVLSKYSTFHQFGRFRRVIFTIFHLAELGEDGDKAGDTDQGLALWPTG